MKKTRRTLEKIFVNDISDNGFVFKIYKELSKPNIRVPVKMAE